MKKTMFLAIMAGAVLAGCVKNEEVVQPEGSPEPITFDAPVVSAPTKATELEGIYPKDKNFAVYAIQFSNKYTTFSEGVSPLYMNNVHCEANKKGENETPDYWAPVEKTYYWPKNGTLTFAAYAPAKSTVPHQAIVWPDGADVSWGETGFTFTDFTVEGKLATPATSDTPAAPATPEDLDPTGQYDLLYSERVYDVTKGDDTKIGTTPYKGVTILFKHALSSIVFTAKADATSGTTIKITGIKVNNVVSKGTFNQNLKADKSGDTDTNTDTDKSIEPAWTVSTNAGDVKNYVVFNGTKVLTSDVAYFRGSTSATNGKRNSDLILIPQLLDNVTVTVKYTIIDDNGTPDDKDDHIADQTSNFNLEEEWKMGKRYTYNIVIGAHKIYFNPTVTDWADAPGIEL